MGPVGLREVNGSADYRTVREVVAGSHAALATLYDKYAPTVFRVALSVGKDRGAAEDVVQDTFLAVWNRAEMFDPALGSLAAWLSTIARNRARDGLRTTARRHRAASFSTLGGDQPDETSTVEWLVASGQLVGAGAPEPEPEAAFTASEADVAVAAALRDLTAPELQAIVLAYRDGLTQPEIAARLGWPLGTVKTRSRRGLRRLREALGPTRGTAAESSSARAELPTALAASASGTASAPPSCAPC
jgi:RNA polymerase sigma-70 factor, ECF subfamily